MRSTSSINLQTISDNLVDLTVGASIHVSLISDRERRAWHEYQGAFDLASGHFDDRQLVRDVTSQGGRDTRADQ